MKQARPRFMKSALCVLLSVVAVFAHADWTPPTHPDPNKIYDEATNDTRSGRYEDALAKFLWFHQNALKLEPSLAGVRLSFALSHWNDLGKVYLPAAEKLRATRDEAGKMFRESAGYRQAFLDFESISGELNENNKTIELFIWLDANKPSVATNIFDLALSVLVEAKNIIFVASILSRIPHISDLCYTSIGTFTAKVTTRSCGGITVHILKKNFHTMSLRWLRFLCSMIERQTLIES